MTTGMVLIPLRNQKRQIVAHAIVDEGDRVLAARNCSLPRGVHFRTDVGRFMAYGKIDRRFRYLGLYDTIEEAAEAARKWRLEHMEWNDADRIPREENGG